jgi:hypothetical protein
MREARCVSLIPWATLHGDSEQLRTVNALKNVVTWQDHYLYIAQATFTNCCFLFYIFDALGCQYDEKKNTARIIPRFLSENRYLYFVEIVRFQPVGSRKNHKDYI